MDDQSGWHEVLVDGWGPLVRAAVCDRVDDAMATARGVLGVAVTDPDGAPADAVERVHVAIVDAIAVETGAHLDELGSQSAWATYDDVWAELGRRWAAPDATEIVPARTAEDVIALLELLPPGAIEHAGALVDQERSGARVIRVMRTDAGVHVDVEGLFRWLATDETASDDERMLAREVIAVARRR